MNNVTYLVIVGIAVMLLMMVSILLAVIYNQRKKGQHQGAMEKLREQQQNQLISQPRGRIHATLKFTAGAAPRPRYGGRHPS